MRCAVFLILFWIEGSLCQSNRPPQSMAKVTPGSGFSGLSGKDKDITPGPKGQGSGLPDLSDFGKDKIPGPKGQGSGFPDLSDFGKDKIPGPKGQGPGSQNFPGIPQTGKDKDPIILIGPTPPPKIPGTKGQGNIIVDPVTPGINPHPGGSSRPDDITDFLKNFQNPRLSKWPSVGSGGGSKGGPRFPKGPRRIYGGSRGTRYGQNVPIPGVRPDDNELFRKTADEINQFYGQPPGPNPPIPYIPDDFYYPQHHQFCSTYWWIPPCRCFFVWMVYCWPESPHPVCWFWYGCWA